MSAGSIALKLASSILSCHQVPCILFLGQTFHRSLGEALLRHITKELMVFLEGFLQGLTVKCSRIKKPMCPYPCEAKDEAS